MKTPTKKLSKAQKNEREYKRLEQLIVHEKQAQAKGFQKIAGVDEAGRGPLAGPVVAAACIISGGILFEGINDSKLLTPLKRKKLFSEIKASTQVNYGIGVVEAKVIDRINIYQATLEAMRQAVRALPVKPDYLLVDGLYLDVDGYPCEKVIQGDRKVHCIAAASVIAKEIRDQIMMDYHAIYPQYRFDENKGYATPEHQKALREHGPCPIHRESFEPVREWNQAKSLVQL